jgi:hypothetical protein
MQILISKPAAKRFGESIIEAQFRISGGSFSEVGPRAE